MNLLQITRWNLYALLITPLLVFRSFYFHYVTSEAFFIMATVEIMLLFYLWHIYFHPEAWKPLTLIEKTFIGFVLVLLVTSFTGVNPVVSFWSSFDRLTGGLMWLHLLIIIVISSRVLRTWKDWERFFFFGTMVGLLVSLFHLLSFLHMQWPFFIQRYSTIGSSTFFSVYVLFQIFFSGMLFLKSSGWMKRYGMIAVCLFVVTLFSSEALAVELSFGTGFILFLSLLGIVHRQKYVKVAGYAVVMFMVVAGFILGLLLFKTDSVVRESFANYSSGARFVLWNIAWEGIKERSFFGWGLENFDAVFLTHYDSCLGSQACGMEQWFDRAHNKLLDVWIESGIIGLGFYLALFFLSFYQLWNGYAHRRIDGKTAFALTAILFAFFLQNLVNLDVSLTLLFWIIVLTYLINVCTVSTKQSYQIQQKKSVFSLVSYTVFFPVLFFFFIIQPLRGNMAIHEWFLATNAQERLSAYDRATRLSSVGLIERRWYLARQSAGRMWIAQINHLPIDQTMRFELLLAEQRLRDSQEMKPYDLFTSLQLGLVYHTQAKFFDSRQFTDAERILSEAVRLNPRNPHPYWALAAVLLEQGKFSEALDLTQQAFDLNPAVGESHQQRLIAAKFSGDQVLFDQFAKEAISLSSALKPYVKAVQNANLEEKRTQLLFELY